MKSALGFALLWVMLAGCEVEGCRALQEPRAVPPPPRQLLRYRPQTGVHRLQLLSDGFIPGGGMLRTQARLDVAVAQEGSGTFSIERTLSAHQLTRNGQAVEDLPLLGTRFVSGVDDRRVERGEMRIEPPRPVLMPAARVLAELLRLGLLLEFPAEPVGLGGTWTGEPSRLSVLPAGQLTARPTYTLQSIEGVGDERTAVIGIDVEIDLVPLQAAGGVTLDGSGSATGTLRVRLKDGVTVEALTEQRFTREIRTEDSTLGYGEFTSAIHLWTTESDAEPDLSLEAPLLDAPSLDAQCELALSSMSERTARAPRQQPMYLGSTLRRTRLPEAQQGRPITDPGARLVLAPTSEIWFNETAVTEGTLGPALRSWTRTRSSDGARPILYVFADRGRSVASLQAQLAFTAANADVRIVAHARAAAVEIPEADPWLATQVEEAHRQSSGVRRRGMLRDLLHGYLALCEPASRALRDVVQQRTGFDAFRDALVPAFLACGCDATRLPDLEVLLYEMGGRPDLRWFSLDDLPAGPDLGTAMHDLNLPPPAPVAPERPAAPAEPPPPDED